MSVERYVATAGMTFTTDPDGPWVPYYRYAKLEAKVERLERAISEQPCDCLRTQSIRGYKCWRCAALEGREP